MLSLIKFFSNRHLLTNLIFFVVITMGILFWQLTSKEEMPDISLDFIRISTSYSGASARDVEYFVTRPLEEAIQGMDGIYNIRSSTSVGVSNIIVEIEQNRSDRETIISNIKTAILDVNLPDEVRDEPKFREFKTSQKAVIDVFMYDTSHHLLDYNSRHQLQKMLDSLENLLISKPYVSSVSKSGYLKQEIQIKIDPAKCSEYKLPISTVINEIKNNNILVPAGSLEDKKESKVTVYAQLEDVETIKNIILQTNFGAKTIKLSDVAKIDRSYEKNDSITKINGYEAVGFNVVKSSSYGILRSVDQIKEEVNKFSSSSLSGNTIKVTMLDDESLSVRNRIDLILKNGAFGFILIIVILLIFLDLKSSIWVAMGIPFSFCFTMITASLAGYTINNITLAAVIIVMGMVVDDAIVVAENITRLKREGLDDEKAAIQGTHYMVGPVVASVLTTCVAFLPLSYFDGRFGKFISAIPVIVIIMLLGSLLESIIILPSHMLAKLPFAKKEQKTSTPHWFRKLENIYGNTLEKLLHYKYLVLIFFIILILASVNIFKNHMKFEMFPNEETTQVTLMAMAPKETKKIQTAVLARKLEEIIMPYIGKEVVGFRSYVARSRRGGPVQENNLMMRIEIVPKDKRAKSTGQLIKEWEKKFEAIKDFEEIRFSKQRFGQDGGSPFVLLIQENNDKIRSAIVKEALEAFGSHKALKNPEEEVAIRSPEYIISLKREKIKQLGINLSTIGSTLRSALEGIILFELREDEEEIDVRLTVDGENKSDINAALKIPVTNNGGYLVPLSDLVTVKKQMVAEAINREDLHRTAKVYADFKENANVSVLDVAKDFENNFFVKIKKKYPSAILKFMGEVKDTRESKAQFMLSIGLAVMLIYIVMVLLFNSFAKPLIIMLSIPFGIIGVIFSFYFHNITAIGFFAFVGIVGLSGVVVNDSIVMLVKLDREKQQAEKQFLSNKEISNIAKTRLLAVILTTVTTVAGLFPTAYGWAGYDSMLAQMMLAMGWGLISATLITLVLVPSLYSMMYDIKKILLKGQNV